MTTHVFIVDIKTFTVHLQYLFVGTGAGEAYVDFNKSTDTALHHSKERMLVGMIADAGRIRKGDLIVFYLQQNFKNGVKEGKFYGIFRARQDGSFLDNNDERQYLKQELEKSLTFRTIIEPYKVYADGVTEWEALDEIKSIQSPNQMLWSLIYRKLKGNRGNTMITAYESDRLCQLIRDKNKRDEMDCENKSLQFDMDSQKIICRNECPPRYLGRKDNLDLVPRLINRYRNGMAFEGHLQAYLVRNLGTSSQQKLNTLIIGKSEVEWTGNEVSCGVGMQRIDIMLSVKKDDQRTVIPIELKTSKAEGDNLTQIERYVDWIRQYYLPNMHSDIQPILISAKMENSEREVFMQSIRQFNSRHPECRDLKNIEFSIADDKINFEEIIY